MEVNDQEQFFEILCTHAIVDQNNAKISTPRFTITIVEDDQAHFIQPAGREVSAFDDAIVGDIAISISPIKVKPEASAMMDYEIVANGSENLAAAQRDNFAAANDE